ncbi:pirin family protein [Leptospira ryugenii]|nr:pirin family protein [Leptospira ryugenii]
MNDEPHSYQVKMQYQVFSDAFHSYGFRCPKPLNPFLNLDLFHMSKPTFPPHPHSGFSAITYLFPSSEGSFQNRDSFGDRSLIEPGSLHWTQAGEGMFHEEIPTELGTDCFGLQMFVKMPAADELSKGQAFHLASDTVPIVKELGKEVRVLTGSYGNMSSPIQSTAPPFLFLDAHLSPETDIRFQVKKDVITLLVAVVGNIEVEGFGSVAEHTVMVLQGEDRDIKCNTTTSKAEFLFLQARHLAEDYHWMGSLCLSTKERLESTFSKLRAGALGNLSPSF